MLSSKSCRTQSEREILLLSLCFIVKILIINYRYAKTVKKLSDLARDRPLNAQDTAIYWVEYVLRHHGAPHMHYPGADLNFFQYNSLDVILFLVTVLYVVAKLFKFVIKTVCCGLEKKQPKQKKN